MQNSLYIKVSRGGARGARPLISIEKYTMVLFSSNFFCKIGIVSLSFVFDKYYPNMY